MNKKHYSELLSGVYFSNILTLEDYVRINQGDHPELVNYVGFSEEDQEMEDKTFSGADIYEEHLEFSQMVLGIKEGRYF